MKGRRYHVKKLTPMTSNLALTNLLRCWRWVWNAVNVQYVSSRLWHKVRESAICDRGTVNLDEAAKKISPEGMWDAGMTFAESVKSRSRSENLPICGPGNSIRRPVGSLSLSDVWLRPRHYNNYIIRLYNEIFVVLTCERSHTMSYTRESSSWTSWGTLCILTVIWPPKVSNDE